MRIVRSPSSGSVRRRVTALLAATLTLLMFGAAGCADEDTDGDEPWEWLQVQCPGKCDGWNSIRSLWQDARNLDLNDLLSVGAGYATEGLNDALDVSDYGSISFGEPELYALSERAENDLTLGNLDKLVTGLAVAFGDRSLTTEVNAVRQAHLQNSADVVYGECSFRIAANLKHDWHLPTGGFDGDVVLGFDAGTDLTTRVIAPFDSELKATGGAPLSALRQARGFILPRSVDDIRAMKPGELLAMRSSGGLGVNLGVGVPILIAEPLSSVSYSIVLSAGVRAHLRGNMDVQLVRLAGDQVVVDIGVDAATLQSARIALSDGWGVQGLLELQVDIAGYGVDLGRLVEKALQKQLNKKLDYLSARAETTQRTTRLSVARMRFALDAGADAAALDQAIAQALRGDVRLAQALANRGEPGVTAEFDLTRSGVSATSYAGIDLFGMSFYREVEESQGSAVIQTPGGARTLLFDSLHREAGWFFSSHGYTRVGLSGLVFDPSTGGLPVGEANFFLQLEEGDEFMERDKLLDHLDGIVLALGGQNALTAVEGPGNELERYVEAACPNSQAFDPCRIDVLSHATVINLRAEGASNLQAAIGHLEQPLQDLIMACGELRLTAQATYEPKAQFVGPDTSVVLDYRLDDLALAGLMVEGNGYQLRNAITHHLQAALIDRIDSPDQIATDRAGIPSSGDAAVVDAMAERYDERSRHYEHLLAAEAAVIERLGPVGPRAIEIRFDVAGPSAPDYESATAAAVSQARARTFRTLFDELVALGNDLDPHAEQTVLYALLAMTQPQRVDLRVDVDLDLSDNLAQDYEHYREAGYAPFDLYARASQVSPIDGGLFDVNALIDLK